MPVRSAAGGANLVLDVSAEHLLTIASSSGAWTLAGLTGGRDGQLLVIRNGGADVMTIAHEAAGAPAYARVRTSTGAAVGCLANQTAFLVYDWLLQRWLLHSVG